jgi:hypothetical protein
MNHRKHKSFLFSAAKVIENKTQIKSTKLRANYKNPLTNAAEYERNRSPFYHTGHVHGPGGQGESIGGLSELQRG